MRHAASTKQMPRRRPRYRAGRGIAAPLFCADALAQNYPVAADPCHRAAERGRIDRLAARVLTQRLDESLKQNMVVDNRPGAGSINGTDIVAKAAPDGYTLLAIAASFTITPSAANQSAVRSGARFRADHAARRSCRTSWSCIPRCREIGEAN